MGKVELTGRQRTFNDTFNRNRWSIGEKKSHSWVHFPSVNQSHFWFCSLNRDEEDLWKLCP